MSNSISDHQNVCHQFYKSRPNSININNTAELILMHTNQQPSHERYTNDFLESKKTQLSDILKKHGMQKIKNLANTNLIGSNKNISFSQKFKMSLPIKINTKITQRKQQLKQNQDFAKLHIKENESTNQIQAIFQRDKQYEIKKNIKIHEYQSRIIKIQQCIQQQKARNQRLRLIKHLKIQNFKEILQQIPLNALEKMSEKIIQQSQKRKQNWMAIAQKDSLESNQSLLLQLNQIQERSEILN